MIATRQFACNGIIPIIYCPQQSILESYFATPSWLYFSIELRFYRSPCPYWSVDCSIACWNHDHQLVPCLAVKVRHEGSFFDFNSTNFLSNNSIFHIIIIAASTKKRKYENGHLSKILMDKDVLWYPVCCLSLTVGRRYHLCLFATTWGIMAGHNSLTSKWLLKPYNPPVWSFIMMLLSEGE